MKFKKSRISKDLVEHYQFVAKLGWSNMDFKTIQRDQIRKYHGGVKVFSYVWQTLLMKNLGFSSKLADKVDLSQDSWLRKTERQVWCSIMCNDINVGFRSGREILFFDQASCILPKRRRVQCKGEKNLSQTNSDFVNKTGKNISTLLCIGPEKCEAFSVNFDTTKSPNNANTILKIIEELLMNRCDKKYLLVMDNAPVNVNPIFISSFELLMKKQSSDKVVVIYLPGNSTEQAPVEKINFRWKMRSIQHIHKYFDVWRNMSEESYLKMQQLIIRRIPKKFYQKAQLDWCIYMMLQVNMRSLQGLKYNNLI